MTDKEAWLDYRSIQSRKGRLRNGLFWGIITGIVNYFFIYLDELADGSSLDVYFTWKGLLILAFAILFNTFLFGRLQWWFMDRGYKRFLQKNLKNT